MLRVFLTTVAALSILVVSGPAQGHYCSNIFKGKSRLVVKAEKTTVSISGGSAKLKVFLQNNFPYRLFKMKMMGTASGYTVSASPTEQDVHPGQQVVYTITISGSSGSIATSKLNLQVRFRVNGWQGATGLNTKQNPTSSELVSYTKWQGTGQQSGALNAAILADKYPTTKLSFWPNKTGLGQLIHWFGYPYCYKGDGKPGEDCFGSKTCPGNCGGVAWGSYDDRFEQNCMRAGVELAIRKSKLGSSLSSAKTAALNAFTNSPTTRYKCLAGVVAGHLYRGTSSTAFTSAANKLSSVCKAASLRAYGQGTKSSCASGSSYEKAACAAAEGLRGNYTPVTSVLMPTASDGETKGGYTGLYYAYMLYLVTGDLHSKGIQPSYYPKVGAPPPKQDTGATPKQDKGVGPQPDTGPPLQLDGFIPGSDSIKPGLDGPLPSADGGAGGPRGDDGGCSCRVSSGAFEGAGVLMFFGLVLVLLIRRRRR